MKLLRIALVLCAFTITPSLAWAQESESSVEDVPSVGDDSKYEEESDEFSRKTLSIGFKLSVWAADLKAKVKAPRVLGGTNLLLGNSVDFEGDLNLDQTIGIGSGEFFITSRFFSLYVDYFSFNEEADTTLDLSLAFAGFVFNAGVPVKSQFEVASAAVKAIIMPVSLETFELGIIVGARYFRARGEIRSVGPIPVEASDSFEAPIPFVGLRARIFVGPIEIYGSFQGLSLSYKPPGDDTRYDATYLEYELGAALNIGDNIAIYGGLRGLIIEVDEVEDDGLTVSNERKNEYELSLTGVTLGVRVRF
ncbi:MAG: hypothetical protein P1V97_20975 [Planctomycetota bacterium]|nr:hypothetical protein [Planctomycetota bacterium]